ncbi:MAG: LysM peptidoglycan-binding domain-containing protein [Anaerolineae bacterium]
MLAGRKRERRCPRCGMRVAQQAQTCLLCGYRLDRGSYLGAILVVAAVAVIAGAAVAAVRDRSSQARSKGTAMAAATKQSAAVLAQAGETPVATTEPSTTIVVTSLPAPTDTSTPSPTPLAPPTDTPTPEPTATDTPLPPPTEVPTDTPTPGPIIHSVESGDSLLYIANKYGTTVDAILEANPGLTKYSILSIGQQITVPVASSSAAPASTQEAGATATTAPAPQFIIHIVEAGDTLGYLASKYDSTVDDIVAANEGLTERTILRIGQEIKIPVTPSAALPVNITPTTEAIPQVTAVAQAEATPGITATALAGPVATPTGSLFAIGGPAQPRALELLSPIGGAKVPVRELMLNWTGVGDLAPDLWYVVHIWPVNAYKDMSIGWTKANSWRPDENLLSQWGANSHLMWNVGIEREVATKENEPQFEPVGPRTEPQDFYLLP